jgi:hypothetical protein
MATADIETVVTIKSVTLTLDPAEAKFVLYVMNSISGSTKYSPRQFADNIIRAMTAAGVTTPRCEKKIGTDTMHFMDSGLAYFTSDNINA